MRVRYFTLVPSFGSAEKSLLCPLQFLFRPPYGGVFAGKSASFPENRRYFYIHSAGLAFVARRCLHLEVLLALLQVDVLWALRRRIVVQIETDGASWFRMLLRRSSGNNTPQG